MVGTASREGGGEGIHKKERWKRRKSRLQERGNLTGEESAPLDQLQIHSLVGVEREIKQLRAKEKWSTRTKRRVPPKEVNIGLL